MFGKHTTFTHIARRIAVAAVVAAVVVPSALASSDRTRTQECQDGVTWTTITDDLGLSQLVPVPTQSTCAADELPCTASTQTGWISVDDDLGLPSLVPTSPTTAAAHGVCVLAQASPPAPAPAAKIKKAKITKSKYRGWVLITDTTGSAKLVSRSDLRG